MNYKTIFSTDSWYYWYWIKNEVISRGYKCDNFINCGGKSRYIFFTDYDTALLSRLINTYGNPQPHEIMTLAVYKSD